MNWGKLLKNKNLNRSEVNCKLLEQVLGYQSDQAPLQPWIQMGDTAESKLGSWPSYVSIHIFVNIEREESCGSSSLDPIIPFATVR